MSHSKPVPGPADPADPVGVQWHPIHRRRAYELVLDQIGERIAHGDLVVGDRLPAERDLAGALGVSRASVREAMRVLEAQGVVESAPGGGPDAGTLVTARPGAAMARFLRLHLGLSHFTVDELVATRVTLEAESARLAARHAGPEQLDGLDEVLDRLDGLVADREGFNDLDTRFHVQIAAAAGNRLTADLTIGLRNSMRDQLLEVFRRIEDFAAEARRLQVEHRRILDALRARDPEAAAREVTAHVLRFAREFVPGATL